MRTRTPPVRTFATAALLGVALLSAAGSAAARDRFDARLEGYAEVPSISTPASGRFSARVDRKSGALYYELSYKDLQGPVRMAHIHIGQHGVNGGIMVWLCQTTSFTDPTGLAPACPASGTVSGVIQPANVIAVGAQGVALMSFDQMLDAINAGVAYVNVHSDRFPGGEIRAQVRDRD